MLHFLHVIKNAKINSELQGFDVDSGHLMYPAEQGAQDALVYSWAHSADCKMIFIKKESLHNPKKSLHRNKDILEETKTYRMRMNSA